MPDYPAPSVQQADNGDKDVSREGIDQRHLGDQHHRSQGDISSPQHRSQRIAEEVDKDESERPPKSPAAVKRAAEKVDDEQADSEPSQEDRDPDQQPLMKGTPLDELKTPMFERPGRGMLSRNPPEDSAVDAGRADEAATAVAGKTQRPGFGAGKEMGSVSRVFCMLSLVFDHSPLLHHFVNHIVVVLPIVKAPCSLITIAPFLAAPSPSYRRYPLTSAVHPSHADHTLTRLSRHFSSNLCRVQLPFFNRALDAESSISHPS
jgi:hypothetical protein